MREFTTLLNQDMTILSKFSWKKGLLMAISGRFIILDLHERTICDTSGETHFLPKTIMVKKYVKHRPKFTPSRRNIFLRDDYKCRYCGEELGHDELTLDHVLPRSRGGGNTWNNLVAACFPCNSRKANRTPEEAGMPLLG